MKRTVHPRSLAKLELVLAATLAAFASLTVYGRPATPGELPLFFQELPANRGFAASGRHSQVLVRPASIDILAANPATLSCGRDTLRSDAGRSGPDEVRALRMTLLGAAAHARLSGHSPISGRIHDLTSAQATADSRAWSQVRATGVYPGIDVAYYANEQRLEYDFILEPGASPSNIRLKFEGARKISIDENGDLVLSLGDSEVRQHRPIVYQEQDGKRVFIDGGYELADANTVGFRVGSYRSDLALVIDPVLSYSTYFGGNSGEIAMAVRVGADGSIYIAGQTLSRSFLFDMPTDAFQPAFRGGSRNGDAFVARFDSTGSNLIYFTYIGGRSDDGALDLAVDGLGNAYLTGFTISDDFPVRNALFPKIHGRRHPDLRTYPKDAFVCVLNPSGSDLVYSTYLGGKSSDVGTAIAVDSTGAASVTGSTTSTNYPVLNEIPGEHKRSGAADAFVTKFAPGGQSIVFSTYMGGNKQDAGQGIAADSSGDIHLTGYTVSSDFPITNAFQAKINNLATNNGAYDAWVAKLNGTGTLLYSSYLGAKQGDAGYRIAVDAASAAYVTGYTQSKKFPNTLTNVAGMTNARAWKTANADAFLCKVVVNSSGIAELAYAAPLGGYFSDVGWDVAVTPSGDAYVIGITTSRNFPAYNAVGSLSATNAGNSDVFVFGLTADASQVIYSGYLGGSRKDFGYGIAVSPPLVILAGRTVSLNFPTANPTQSNRYGGNDAFLSILTPDVSPAPSQTAD